METSKDYCISLSKIQLTGIFDEDSKKIKEFINQEINKLDEDAFYHFLKNGLGIIFFNEIDPIIGAFATQVALKRVEKIIIFSENGVKSLIIER
ncbi:hypothetical protein EOM09_01805 [bacterium]|nr:hypothetical protein [bacterium]